MIIVTLLMCLLLFVCICFGIGQVVCSKIFADQKVNIENLKALMPEEEKRALLVFEISLPMEIDRNALRRTLKDKARTLGLQLSMQHRDIFEALHRVQPV